MEYASNGKGNLGVTLGAIGTGLGVLNGGLGGILGGFGANPAAAAAMAAGDSDNHFVSRYEAGQSARIAELETEVKLRDANAYTDKKILEVYPVHGRQNALDRRAALPAARYQRADHGEPVLHAERDRDSFRHDQDGYPHCQHLPGTDAAV